MYPRSANNDWYIYKHDYGVNAFEKEKFIKSLRHLKIQEADAAGGQELLKLLKLNKSHIEVEWVI